MFQGPNSRHKVAVSVVTIAMNYYRASIDIKRCLPAIHVQGRRLKYALRLLHYFHRHRHKPLKSPMIKVIKVLFNGSIKSLIGVSVQMPLIMALNVK